MVYIYQSHLGALYVSDRYIPDKDLYCVQCGESDFLALASNDLTEIGEYLRSEASMFGLGGYDVGHLTDVYEECVKLVSLKRKSANKEMQREREQRARIMSILKAQYDRKNADYGNSASYTFARFGVVSYLVRISDKTNRYLTLKRQEAQVKNESICDTLGDMVTYCCMLLADMNHFASCQFDDYIAVKEKWPMEFAIRRFRMLNSTSSSELIDSTITALIDSALAEMVNMMEDNK